MSKNIRRLGLSLALTLFAALGLVSTASAATTVYVDAFGQLQVSAATGVANHIDVYPWGGMSTYNEVTDSADVVTAGTGCTANGANSVYCGGVTSTIVVVAGDQDDYVSGYWLADPFYVGGGIGDDEIIGSGSTGNTLVGNQGNDTLTGGESDDAINGSSGVDSMDGREGSDTMWGGTGNDFIEMWDREGDSADCGGGTDVASADALPLDSTVSSCETVYRS